MPTSEVPMIYNACSGAIRIQCLARGMLIRKASKGRVSLNAQGIDFELITDAMGSPLEATRMRGVLRCIAPSFNKDTVSSDERIGRDVIGKMRRSPARYPAWWFSYGGRDLYKIDELYHALHLNRPERATVKQQFDWVHSLILASVWMTAGPCGRLRYGDKPFRGVLCAAGQIKGRAFRGGFRKPGSARRQRKVINGSVAFQAAKWFITTHGGWSAHEMRAERQKEFASQQTERRDWP